jgi:predicted ATP-grasp superfamily ATP-dependent carboligase
VSRQLVGDDAFGAAGYRYCGNILEPAGDAALVDRACTLARAAAEEFGLVGVNGIDFVARAGVPYAIEVNPRWSSSMELVERAYGFPVFEAHAAACADGTADFDPRAPRCARRSAKPGLRAPRCTVGDTLAWVTTPMTMRRACDIPRTGTRMALADRSAPALADAPLRRMLCGARGARRTRLRVCRLSSGSCYNRSQWPPTLHHERRPHGEAGQQINVGKDSRSIRPSSAR